MRDLARRLRRLALALAWPWLLALGAGAEVPSGRLVAGALEFRYPPEFERVATELAAHGPADLERICETLGLPPPPRARVLLLPRKGGGPLRYGLPVGPEWAAGWTYSDRPEIVLHTAETTSAAGGSRASQVFTHELVHLVTSQALGPRHGLVPTWLEEGTAAELAFEWRITDSARALRFAVGRSFVPLARLRQGFPAEAQRASDAYFQSQSFVGWLVQEGGEERFRGLWQRLHRGEDFDAAFRAVYGERLRALEERWQRHFLRRYAWIPLLTSASTPWLVVMGLVLVGWVRKKRRGAERLRAWEEEERQAELAGPERPGAEEGSHRPGGTEPLP